MWECERVKVDIIQGTKVVQVFAHPLTIYVKRAILILSSVSGTR